ncbi:MAG: Fe-S cluster assembly ATPase SufC [Candidatus Alkanophagales archaeon MCA70_species_2]|nr:Fe-S cluster assembly ATPase SufC [Candidatus Alkanophaga liquidiphilum]
MLEVRELWVRVRGKEVLRGVNLSVGKEETHVLMGHNACGKTSLALTIMGYPSYGVVKGSITFEGQEITSKPIHERAKLGIALAHQSPPEVRGVKLRDLIRVIVGEAPWNPLLEAEESMARKYVERVGLDASFLSRDLNVGFSGGERKRSELAQVFAMRPKLMILDEPDSGVDIDSLKLIGEELRRAIEELRCSTLIITHHGYILQYLDVDVAHVMYEGRIVARGAPEELVPRVEREGYEAFVRTLRRCT